MLKLFRFVSVAEGLSLLVILSVTLLVSHRREWAVGTWLLVLAAGMVPFAFVLVEAFLKKEERRSEAAA